MRPLAAQNFTTATLSYNTAVGFKAGLSVTTGTENTLVGGLAGDALTTSSKNVAVGYASLSNATSQANNTAVGNFALYDLNGGNGRNTAVGDRAIENATSGDSNVAIGYFAGGQLTTGDANVFIGGGEFGVSNPAGYDVTEGNANTFVGHSAGHDVTTGSNNTILGSYSGNQGGLDIRTGSNNIVLSDGDGNVRLYVSSNGRVGIGDFEQDAQLRVSINALTTQPFVVNDSGNNAASTHRIGFRTGNTEVGSIKSSNSATSYNTSSDHRLKENVVVMTGATARLKQLAPKRFNFIVDPDDTTVDGFLAHEVQSVVPEAITGTHNEVDEDGNPVYQGIDQSKLVPLLVATIQELEARITALES
jgi:hypothetical protein